MSIAQLEAQYTVLAAALDDADYASAITAAEKIIALVDSSPSLMNGLGQSGDSINYRSPAELRQLIAGWRSQLRASTIASTGIFAQSPVRYARAEE